MDAPPPPPETTSPWLPLAGRLGRIAVACLLVENFLLLFAPLFFLLNLPSNARLTPSPAVALPVYTDAGLLLSLADLFSVIGFVILAPVLFLILLGLWRSGRRPGFDALLPGIAALACVAALVPVKLYAQGRAAGTIASLDQVVATGGWSVASGLLLGASLAYLVFTLRVEAGAKPLRLTCLKWPVYAAVNVLGAVAIAGFFQGLAAGSPNFDAYTLGIVLKVTLVPMLGVLAYRDLYDRIPAWGKLPSMGNGSIPPSLPSAAVRGAQPPPPPSAPPADSQEGLPLPPPPDD